MDLERLKILLVAIGILLGSAVALPAQEPELLADLADGMLTLEGENKLSIRDLQGAVSVRPGKAGEIRYSARSSDNRREERPVALWLDGRTLQFRPLAGQEGEKLILQISISPELAGEIELVDSRISAGGFGGGLELRGRNLKAELFSIGESLRVELEGGTLGVESVAGDASLDTRGTEVKVNRVSGYLTLVAQGAPVELFQLGSDVEASLDAVDLKVEEVRGAFRASAEGGSLALSQLMQGAELRLDEAAVSLSGSKGSIEIDTNAEVRFRDLEASLRVTSYGGNIRGQGSAGPLELTTSGAEVVLENLGASAQVQGDDLTVRVKGVRGDLLVRTTGSNLVLEDLQGTVDVENDFGDIIVKKAAKGLKVVSRDGDVRIIDLSGPLNLKSDGNEVRVSWAAMAQDGDSEIENERGDVWLGFPPKGGGRLEVEAKAGRIESSVAGVRVTDDGNFASGLLGRANRPTIQVKAGANVYIATAGPGKAPTSGAGGQ